MVHLPMTLTDLLHFPDHVGCPRIMDRHMCISDEVCLVNETSS